MKSYRLLPFVLLFACTQREQNKPVWNLAFQPPAVVQDLGTDTLIHHSSTYLTNSYCRIAAKSFATDTLFFRLEDHMDTSVEDYLDRRSIDTLVSYDGFELHPDYSTSVYRRFFAEPKAFAFYPLYVLNRSASIKLFPGKDGSAFGIQEALDSSGTWRPIEGKGLSICGNGRWKLPIRPQEFLVVLMPKYTGNYHTKLRVRLKIGDMVYVSQAFNGQINYRQFFIEKGSYFDHAGSAQMASAVQWQFYGGRPLEKASLSEPEPGPAVYSSQPSQ